MLHTSQTWLHALCRTTPGLRYSIKVLMQRDTFQICLTAMTVAYGNVVRSTIYVPGRAACVSRKNMHFQQSQHGSPP